MDAGTYDVEITGDLAPVAEGTDAFWRLPVTVSGTVPDDMPDDERSYFMSSPLIVWAYDGRVVDLGTGWHEADPDVSVALSDDGAWSGAARAGNSTSCREETLVPTASASTTTSGPGRATSCAPSWPTPLRRAGR